MLIEPSEMAMSRAKNWIDAKLKTQANIEFSVTTRAYEFDELELSGTSEYIDGTALHLFSNVLDVYSSHRFDMQNLVELTKTHFKQHYFLAISPDYYSGNLGFSAFLRHLKPQEILVQQRQDIEITEYHTYNKRLQNRMTPVHALVCYQSVEEMI